jgi:hypothetical protein
LHSWWYDIWGMDSFNIFDDIILIWGWFLDLFTIYRTHRPHHPHHHPNLLAPFNFFPFHTLITCHWYISLFPYYFTICITIYISWPFLTSPLRSRYCSRTISQEPTFRMPVSLISLIWRFIWAIMSLYWLYSDAHDKAEPQSYIFSSSTSYINTISYIATHLQPLLYYWDIFARVLFPPH